MVPRKKNAGASLYSNSDSEEMASTYSGDNSEKEEDLTQGSKEEDDLAENEDEEDTIEYENVELDASGVPISSAELDDDDVEFWLFRIPTHEPLIKELVGKKISVKDMSGGPNNEHIDAKIGNFKGGYFFRDHGVTNTEAMRASFVVDGEDGEPQLRLTKPFSRSVSVTFDVSLTNLDHVGQKQRMYPARPTGLKVQYRPIGSKRSRLVPSPVRQLSQLSSITSQENGAGTPSLSKKKKKKKKKVSASMN